MQKLRIILAKTDIHQGQPTRGAQGQLRLAKKKRRKVRNNSFKERQEFLDAKAAEAAADLQQDGKGPTKAKILISMKRAEAQSRMYRTLQ